LPHHGYVDVDEVRNLLQGVDDRAQRLRQQRLVFRRAGIERNRPLLADAESLVQPLLVQRHAEHAIARLESPAVGVHHRAGHLVQRVPDDHRVLRVVGLEEQQVGPAQAGEFHLEDNVARGAIARRPRFQPWFGHFDEVDLPRGVNVAGKQSGHS